MAAAGGAALAWSAGSTARIRPRVGVRVGVRLGGRLGVTAGAGVALAAAGAAGAAPFACGGGRLGGAGGALVGGVQPTSNTTSASHAAIRLAAVRMAYYPGVYSWRSMENSARLSKRSPTRMHSRSVPS